MQKTDKLGPWFATAISGNSIFSTPLYVSGIAIAFAGIYAPLIFLIIAGILFLYKAVYTEVIEALPINGGVYNCLLNATSKTIAAVAGVITILSYIAAAVISAKVAIDYLHTILPVAVIPSVILLLLFFAVLVISGTKDSARVAFVIFLVNIVVLLTFIVLGLLYFLQGNPSFFLENIFQTQAIINHEGGIVQAFFLAFSVALLGVSGFESSANFVEDQKKGVFRKTLRNMLIGTLIFNPLISFVALNSLPIAQIVGSQDFLLANVGNAIGGPLFKYIIVIDAFLVLSGAVLASYVGVKGLVYRMASDACLPNWLTHQRKSGASPRIIVAFLFLCISILLVTQGNLLALAGVYTIAFLSVMLLFAIGNLILRETRSDLKRTYQAPLLFVILAFIATAIGIVGNIKIDANNLTYFGIYFLPAVLLILAVVYEDYNIKLLMRITRKVPPLHNYLEKHLENMTQDTLVAFVNHVSRVHRILKYVDRNESGWNLVLVHCNNGDTQDYKKTYKEIEEALPMLQKVGAFPYFNIQLIHKDMPFGPKAINTIAKEFKVRKNRILIGSIHNSHEFDYSELGGVRIIF